MSPTKTYFRPTTAQQRKLLFETWEATGNVPEACQTARVSRMTFYYWKKRFEQEGYAGLEHPRSHTPKHLPKTSPTIEQQVIAMYQAHPDWGKKRIEQELAKANNWVPVVSLNTVRRILADAGMWRASSAGKKRRRAKERPPRG